MLRIACDDTGDQSISWREKEIYQTVIQCRESRYRLKKLYAFSGWIMALLIGGLVGFASRKPYLVVIGAPIAWWITRQLVWRVLRRPHDLLGEVVLQLRQEPCGVTLAEKLISGSTAFMSGDKSGSAHGLHLMYEEILDSFRESGDEAFRQFLEVKKVEPVPPSG